MKFTKIAATLGALALTGSLAACGGSDDTGSDAGGDKIKIGIKFDQPGLGFKEADGGYSGFDVAMAEYIAEGMGYDEDQIEWVEAVSANRETFLKDGTVDMILATYSITDERKAEVDFAGPYYIAGQDVMVKASDTSIKGVNDLAGKKTCSVRNSTPAANVKRLVPTADLTEFDQYSDCVQALRDKRVQSVTTDNSILLGFVAQSPTEFKIVGNKFTDEPYGIGVKRGDDAFRTFINDRLEAIYANGEWAKLFAATLGKLGIPTPTPPPVNRYASAGVAPATTTTVAASTTSTSRP
jgi:glutamate transport system substrate-binding protein